MNLLDFEYLGLLVGFLVSLIFSITIVSTTKWHGKFTLDETTGIQKNHEAPIARIGGVAVMAGLVSVYFISGSRVTELLGPILIACLPAFSFGVIEDLTKRVSVRVRLIATMTSGVIAWALTGNSITQVGVWGIDAGLAWLPFSVIFTAFAVGGVANAINIIDGFNGLASGTVAICIFALGVIATNVGDHSLAALCFSICAVVAGFIVVNFPFGKLFLGDGGAYMLGFVMAWLAIMLPARNPSVSVWASFLACGYPIFETLFTIGRRLWARTHPGKADSEHLHSLVKVAVSNRLFAGLRPVLSNAFVSPFCWTIAALAAGLATRHPNDSRVLVISAVGCFLVYLVFYWYVAASAENARRTAERATLTVVPLHRSSTFLPVDHSVEEAVRIRTG